MVGMSILPQVLVTEGQIWTLEHCTSWNMPAAVLQSYGAQGHT